LAPGVLDFRAPREAKKMLVGKTGYGPVSCKQGGESTL